MTGSHMTSGQPDQWSGGVAGDGGGPLLLSQCCHVTTLSFVINTSVVVVVLVVGSGQLTTGQLRI